MRFSHHAKMLVDEKIAKTDVERKITHDVVVLGAFLVMRVCSMKETVHVMSSHPEKNAALFPSPFFLFFLLFFCFFFHKTKKAHLNNCRCFLVKNPF